MPDYDFYCRQCKHPFSSHMSVREHDEQPAECPRCHKAQNVEKRLSAFSAHTRKKS
ncbi:zinc ribbon domain-containing protein [Myxococcus sp. K15C18031901]|uniref:FmdB family zinc ribbon protein n=1 Tax=Myxococcus dinghuensis TaxID=2906761 RepID=UPI0020A6F186|nr:FmdB family zinc ribbon protein [Myxococcus dinghuensis]MCP3103861.1 zinc ribbon domain-containing protein [Myxococcus dinghuensis]